MQEDSVCCRVSASVITESQTASPLKKTGCGCLSMTSSRGQEGNKNKTSYRCTITAWAEGWGTAVPSVHIWQKRARRRWAWLPRWPACSPSRFGTRRRSRCRSPRRRIGPARSLGRRGRPAVRQPWWTLQRGKNERRQSGLDSGQYIHMGCWRKDLAQKHRMKKMFIKLKWPSVSS